MPRYVLAGAGCAIAVPVLVVAALVLVDLLGWAADRLGWLG